MERRKVLSGVMKHFKARGQTLARSLDEFEEYYSEVYEQLSQFHDGYPRVMPIEVEWGSSIRINEPRSPRVSKGLVTYSQALLNVDPANQILNYWRTLEAISGREEKQISFFENLLDSKLPLHPVYGMRIAHVQNDGTLRREDEKIDVCRIYLRHVRRTFKKMLGHHGNYKALHLFFKSKLRHKAAHGDNNVLRPSSKTPLYDLFNYALILKLVARKAIEAEWKRSLSDTKI